MKKIINVFVVAIILNIFIFSGVIISNAHEENKISSGEIDDILDDNLNDSARTLRLNIKQNDTFGEYNILDNNMSNAIDIMLKKFLGKDANIKSLTDIKTRYSKGIEKKDYKDLVEGDIVFLDDLGTATVYLGGAFGHITNLPSSKEIGLYSDKFNLIKDWYSGYVINIDYVVNNTKKDYDTKEDVKKAVGKFKSTNSKEQDIKKIRDYTGKVPESYDVKKDNLQLQKYVKDIKELTDEDCIYVNYMPMGVLDTELKESLKTTLKGKKVKIFNFYDDNSAYASVKFYSDLTGKPMLNSFPLVFEVKNGVATDITNDVVKKGGGH